MDIMFTKNFKNISSDTLRRENILKSIVTNIITQVRIEKSKPKLGDLLKLFNRKDGKPVNKEAVLRRIRQLYSKDEIFDIDDIFVQICTKFRTLMTTLDS